MTPPGKHVGRDVYVHRAALACRPSADRDAVALAIRCAGLADDAWNVAKIATPQQRVSLLSYAAFFTDPFPALVASHAVNLATGRVRVTRWRHDGNPPILHRKELLLPAAHPDRPKFAALTQQLDERGLLRKAGHVGRRRPWQDRLAAAGVTVRDHVVVDVN